MESYRCEVPFTFGWLFPVIVLPAIREQEDLGMILKHELIHVKYQDVFWLRLCVLAERFFWFNPLISSCTAKYRNNMEYHCDYVVCRDMENTLPYRKLLARYGVMNQTEGLLSAPGITESKSLVVRRIQAIQERRLTMTRGRKVKTVFAALGIVMLSNLTVYAGISALIMDELAGSSVVQSNWIEIPYEEFVLEEHITTDGSCGTDLFVDESVNPDARSVSVINWNLVPNQEGRSSTFYGQEGESVQITINMEDDSGTVWFGLVRVTDGMRIHAELTGDGYHKFTIPSSGTYCVFIWNKGSQELAVEASVMR